MNFMNVIQKNIFYIGAVIDLTILDLVSKWLIEANLSVGQSLTVMQDVLNISVSHNDAIAFSLPVPGRLVAFVTPLLLAGLFYLVGKSCNMDSKITKIALVLMTAGALGNLIDRVGKGYVVDFIDFSFFPSFNLADAYLSIGVVVLIAGYRWIAKDAPAATNF